MSDAEQAEKQHLRGHHPTCRTQPRSRLISRHLRASLPGKVVAGGAEGNAKRGALVAVQGVEQLALPQVPDLQHIAAAAAAATAVAATTVAMAVSACQH